jgi:hypothetical protein
MSFDRSIDLDRLIESRFPKPKKKQKRRKPSAVSADSGVGHAADTQTQPTFLSAEGALLETKEGKKSKMNKEPRFA